MAGSSIGQFDVESDEGQALAFVTDARWPTLAGDHRDLCAGAHQNKGDLIWFYSDRGTAQCPSTLPVAIHSRNVKR